MKRIGLVIAAAMLGTTGVASAGIAVHQFTSSNGSQTAALDAKTEQLAADCWVATGTGTAADCNTSAAAPGLPGLDEVTGLVDAEGLIETAQGLAARATNAAGDVATQAAGASPLDCTVSAGVPSGVVPPAVGGAVPAEVAATAGKALDTVGEVTGIDVGLNGSGTTAAGCSADASGVATAGSGAVTGAVGKAGSVAGTATGVVEGVTGAAGGVVEGVTGAAGGVVEGVTGAAGGVVEGVTGAAGTTAGGLLGGLTTDADNLLGGGAADCSASGGASSGLLGSVSLSGSC